MVPNKQDVIHKGAITGLLATAMFFSLGPIAWADRDMGGHPDMSMEGHGHDMGEGKGYGMHGPHNAAKHLLMLGKKLNLTDDQTKTLTKMRDDYIASNSTTEEQLKASYSDMGRTLYGDDVDMKKVDELLGKTGKMESQLWRAYAQQLHDIKAMLTADQKQALKDMFKDRHGKMKDEHGDMGKGHDDMPGHKGM